MGICSPEKVYLRSACDLKVTWVNLEVQFANIAARRNNINCISSWPAAIMAKCDCILGFLLQFLQRMTI